MNYNRGEIVWVKFPFSDTSSTKLRPALIISNNLVNKTEDYILMQITSRQRNDGLSLAIIETDFTGPPLLKQSELMIHKIFIINESLIAGSITSVSSGFMEIVTTKLLKLVE